MEYFNSNRRVGSWVELKGPGPRFQHVLCKSVSAQRRQNLWSGAPSTGAKSKLVEAEQTLFKHSKHTLLLRWCSSRKMSATQRFLPRFSAEGGIWPHDETDCQSQLFPRRDGKLCHIKKNLKRNEKKKSFKSSKAAQNNAITTPELCLFRSHFSSLCSLLFVQLIVKIVEYDASKMRPLCFQH